MTSPTYRFGPYLLERGAYRLSRGSEAIALPPKVIDLLFLLVSRPSSLVSKDQILQAMLEQMPDIIPITPPPSGPAAIVSTTTLPQLSFDSSLSSEHPIL